MSGQLCCGARIGTPENRCGRTAPLLMRMWDHCRADSRCGADTLFALAIDIRRCTVEATGVLSVRARGQRQIQIRAEPSHRGLTELQISTVEPRDVGDNGQPQPAAG